MHSEMIGRPTEKAAPAFGQRLAAARKAKGWTQRELADALETTIKMVDYYERRAVNPALEVVQMCARALDVPVSSLIGEGDPAPAARKPGPVSQLERRFEQVKRLPREKQKFVLQFLETVLEKQETEKA